MKCEILSYVLSEHMRRGAAVEYWSFYHRFLNFLQRKENLEIFPNWQFLVILFVTQSAAQLANHSWSWRVVKPKVTLFRNACNMGKTSGMCVARPRIFSHARLGVRVSSYAFLHRPDSARTNLPSVLYTTSQINANKLSWHFWPHLSLSTG